MMILILAQKDDMTAAMLRLHFNKIKIPCTIVSGSKYIRFNVTANNTGQTFTQLTCRGRTVKAIINRGFYTTGHDFNTAETMAAWWSVMASFNGPVINRPSRLGFLPFIDDKLICSGIENLRPARVIYINNIARLNKQAIETSDINIHTLQPNAYLGRFDDAKHLDTNQAYKLTAFNKNNTYSFIIAGHDSYCLNYPADMVAPALQQLINNVKQRLAAYHACFYYLVIESTGSKFNITYTSPFPVYNHYKHMATQVNNSIYKYLTL